MARSTTGAGNNQEAAAGQENQKAQVLFDENSTSHFSQIFTVDTNFIRVAAFNMVADEIFTVEQVTGFGAGEFFSDYCPVNGPITLYFNDAIDQRNSYILERPGRYRLRYTGTLGMVRAFATRFYMENEASQDIADALFAVLKEFKPNPCTIGAQITSTTDAATNVLSLDSANCIVSNPLPAPDPCILGSQIPDSPAPNPVRVVGKDNSNCLISFLLIGNNAPNVGIDFIDTRSIDFTVAGNIVQADLVVSPNPGNQLSVLSNGAYVPPGSGGGGNTPCSFGALVPVGNPVYLLGVDSAGCVVKFLIVPGDGITITYDTVNNQVIINNACFPCGSVVTDIVGTLCTTTAPGPLSASCDAAPGSVTYSETTVLTMSGVSGGTGPYTYDFTNLAYTPTWTGVGGTVTTTPTVSGNHITIVSSVAGGNATASGSFSLAFTAGSYVLVTDSVAATQKWYVTGIAIAGQCSNVHTAPGSGLTYNAAITCTAAPCTAPTNLSAAVSETHQTSPPIVVNTQLNMEIAFGASGDNRDCGGSIVAGYSGISCTISDPLNTMGTGTTYFPPISTPVLPEINDGPNSDMSTTAVIPNNLEVDWVCTTSGPPTHAPVNGTNVEFFPTAIIPNALKTDGATHVVTWTITGPTISVFDNDSSGDCPSVSCCATGVQIACTIGSLTASFTGTTWN